MFWEIFSLSKLQKIKKLRDLLLGKHALKKKLKLIPQEDQKIIEFSHAKGF